MRTLYTYRDFANLRDTCIEYIEIYRNSMTLDEEARTIIENQLATLCNLLYIALRHCSIRGFPVKMGETVDQLLKKAEKIAFTDWFAHIQIVASYNHFISEFGSKLPKPT